MYIEHRASKVATQRHPYLAVSARALSDRQRPGAAGTHDTDLSPPNTVLEVQAPSETRVEAEVMLATVVMAE
jgi:hypothetical protein